MEKNELRTRIFFAPKNNRFENTYELRNHNFVSKTADLKENDELRNRIVAQKKADLEKKEIRTRNFASKMADLNLSPEPVNLVKLHFRTEHGRSEPKSGALKKWR